jgi:hypothetical protein
MRLVCLVEAKRLRELRGAGRGTFYFTFKNAQFRKKNWERVPLF